MPFDLDFYSSIQAELPLDLPHILWKPEPTLAMLAKALRDEHLWPKGFEWDYGDMPCCGLGLANALWGENRLNNNPDAFDGQYAYFMMKTFGLEAEDVGDLFFFDAEGAQIFPKDVADGIDAWLAEKAFPEGTR